MLYVDKLGVSSLCMIFCPTFETSILLLPAKKHFVSSGKTRGERCIQYAKPRMSSVELSDELVGPLMKKKFMAECQELYKAI